MPGTQSSVERSRHHGKIEDLSSSARTLWHTICLIVWLARTRTMSIWCPRPDRRRQAFAEILSLYSRLSTITSEVSEYLTTSKEDAVPSTVWHRYNTKASASLSPSLPRNTCLEPVLSFPSFSNFASGIQTVYVSFDHWINQARTVLSFLKQKYRLLLARLILASAVVRFVSLNPTWNRGPTSESCSVYALACCCRPCNQIVTFQVVMYG